MKHVYTLIAYRWAQLEEHAYLVCVVSDQDKAIEVARDHNAYRGGKYTVKIYETKVDLTVEGCEEMHREVPYSQNPDVINVNDFFKSGELNPKEITVDEDGSNHIAHFDYYTGISFCKQHQIKQTVDLSTGFIVCCGDVMLKITKDDFPDIERRVLK